MSQVLNERVDLPVLISGFKLLPLLFCWYGFGGKGMESFVWWSVGTFQIGALRRIHNYLST